MPRKKPGQRDPIAVEIGERIAQARKLMGLTRKQFGKRVGIKEKTLGSYETGTRKAPYSALIRIAEATGRSITAFLGRGGDQELANDEIDLLAAYRLTRQPTLKQSTLEGALRNLKIDEQFRREESAEG